MTTKIIIEVHGGRIQAVTSTEDIEITIIDHDEDVDDINRHSKDIYHPDTICTEEKSIDSILREILEEING